MGIIKKYGYGLMFIFITSIWIGCGSGDKSNNNNDQIADLLPEDPIASAIIDKVVKSCGGMSNFESKRYFAWDFFGERNHYWDKMTGDIRIESGAGDVLILMNVISDEGRAWVNQVEITEPDTLKKYMNMGKHLWTNDSYWVFMPFKLKDPGVHLTHVGEKNTERGEFADIIEVTFDNVGLTPENKYHVYVDKITHRVVQWDYFSKAANEKPQMVTSWEKYEKAGGLWFSTKRNSAEIKNIRVFESLPENVFRTSDPVSGI